ncbi:MAG: hypothetical protein EPN47_01350 [Acidobacteria bacterium]|nr:MAG: hypothetical protein EPN47_01350 [Acidobacteriota bacterium]
MTEVNDAKDCPVACGLLAFVVFGAFLSMGCRAAPVAARRSGPLHLGTNAVLYTVEDADLIASLGSPGKVGARVTFYWSDIEPTDGNWQFAVYDDLVKRATDGNIPLLGVVAYAMKRVAATATSMQGDPWALSFCPPDDIGQFATFAGMAAARYPQVKYWEIWNEPNAAYFWRPSPEPARYTELLKSSYAAVKAANPNAVVVLGGLSPGVGSGQLNTTIASSFLQSVYQNGGKNYFDAVGFHPYNGGAPPDSYLAGYVNSVHDVMAQNGDGNKPVWVTEIGWYVGTGGNALSEAQQADYLSSAFTILYDLNFVQRAYWYNLKDYSNPATAVVPSPGTVCGPGVGTPVDYGLFQYSGSPRPAADAFRKAVQ